MGSPLSPIIADLVMEDLEKSVLDTINVDIQFYYRYVDDIIMALPNNKVDLIVDSFNEQHERLKFTVEFKDDHVINFLDLSIKTINNIIFINGFRKKHSLEELFPTFRAIHYVIKKTLFTISLTGHYYYHIIIT